MDNINQHHQAWFDASQRRRCDVNAAYVAELCLLNVKTVISIQCWYITAKVASYAGRRKKMWWWWYKYRHPFFCNDLCVMICVWSVCWWHMQALSDFDHMLDHHLSNYGRFCQFYGGTWNFIPWLVDVKFDAFSLGCLFSIRVRSLWKVDAVAGLIVWCINPEAMQQMAQLIMVHFSRTHLPLVFPALIFMTMAGIPWLLMFIGWVCGSRDVNCIVIATVTCCRDITLVMIPLILMFQFQWTESWT